jgi:hypothetical protein
MSAVRDRKWFAGFSYRLPAYMFPIALLFIEFGLRQIGKLATDDVGGPTLATIGAGMVATLTSFRKAPTTIPRSVRPYLNETGAILEAPSGHLFRNISWVVTLILVVGWVFTVVMAHTPGAPEFLQIRIDYWLGISSVAVGFIMSEVKEMLS